MRLIDKYRPQTFADFIGNPKALAQVRQIVERPTFDGDAFWFFGPSGVGKTSLANILAAMFASDLDIIELDGEACTIDAVRKAGELMHYSAAGRMRVWIINEAQAMTAKAVQAWLTLLDRLPRNKIVIFTTTCDSADLFGEFDGPFRSRCKTVKFSKEGFSTDYAARLVEIADAEGLNGHNGDSLAAARRLVKLARNNFRDAIQAVDNGELL